MPKTELDGLPVIDTDESEELTIAVKPSTLRKAVSATLSSTAAAARS
jgi:hypothetical protein